MKFCTGTLFQTKISQGTDTLGTRQVYQMEIFTLKVQLSQKKFPKTPAEKGQGG
jgi:hypothetical protein